MNLLALLPGYRELVRQLEEQQAVTESTRQELQRSNNTCDMLKKELHTVEKDVERYVEDNAALHETISKANLDIARYSVELVELRRENVAYGETIVEMSKKLGIEKSQALVQPTDRAAIPARPRAKKKAASE